MARKRNQDARRRELLHAAVSVINERGPAGVQMKDVARAANMATGSVYYYYDGVEELLRHMHHMAFERYLTHRLGAVSALEDPQHSWRPWSRSVSRRPRTSRLLALYPDSAEYDAILTALPVRHRLMVETDINTGLRWGELIALKRRHVDLIKRTLKRRGDSCGGLDQELPDGSRSSPSPTRKTTRLARWPSPRTWSTSSPSGSPPGGSAR